FRVRARPRQAGRLVEPDHLRHRSDDGHALLQHLLVGADAHQGAADLYQRLEGAALHLLLQLEGTGRSRPALRRLAAELLLAVRQQGAEESADALLPGPDDRAVARPASLTAVF